MNFYGIQKIDISPTNIFFKESRNCFCRITPKLFYETWFNPEKLEEFLEIVPLVFDRLKEFLEKDLFRKTQGFFFENIQGSDGFAICQPRVGN